jgi:hypothetical protein
MGCLGLEAMSVEETRGIEAQILNRLLRLLGIKIENGYEGR